MSLTKQQVINEFVQAMQACRNLYIQCGLKIANQYPHLIPDHEHDFVAMMDDLHKGLLIKLFVTVGDSDLELSREEAVARQSVVAPHLAPIARESFDERGLVEGAPRIRCTALVQLDSTVRRDGTVA